jgi:hypothetical protein
VAQVLRRAAAYEQDGPIVGHIGFVEGDLGVQTVACALDVGVPTGLEIVHHEMQTALARRGDDRLMTGFLEAVDGVEGFVALAAVAGDDQDLHSPMVVGS